MWSKMLGALAAVALVAVGAGFATGPMQLPGAPRRTADETGMRPFVPAPTFSQVQAQLRGEKADAPTPDVNAAPWARAERNSQGVRTEAREQALRALEDIARPACRRSDFEALGYYFEQRGMQERGYAASWGQAGAQFIAQAWATPEDLRIIELTREAYQAGWLAADALARPHRELMFRLIGNVKQSKLRCS